MKNDLDEKLSHSVGILHKNLEKLEITDKIDVVVAIMNNVVTIIVRSDCLEYVDGLFKKFKKEIKEYDDGNFTVYKVPSNDFISIIERSKTMAKIGGKQDIVDAFKKLHKDSGYKFLSADTISKETKIPAPRVERIIKRSSEFRPNKGKRTGIWTLKEFDS